MMLPVSITAYCKESGTTLIPKLQAAITTNACFIIDFTRFSPTEISLTIEGDSADLQNTLHEFSQLGITFTEYSEFEKKTLAKRKGDVLVQMYLVTGRKKDIGNILDDRMRE